MLHPVVSGVANQPPAGPLDGEGWIVGAAPTGDWAGLTDAIATYQSGNWTFTTPVNGMRAFDSIATQDIRYRNGWTRATAPAAPTGGTTIDSEARTAIIQLIAVLVQAGILPEA